MSPTDQSVPEPGSERVMHLVQAFEKHLTILISAVTEEKEDEKVEEEAEDAKKGLKGELPGLRVKAPETQVSSSSFCPSDVFLTSESLGLNSHVSCSFDSSQGSFSISNRRQRRITAQHPFKLRTEERGRSKQEEFLKKVKQMMMEEEKQRIPVAQGLPRTTYKPECLARPPVKEMTKPIDLVLHSDVRAAERAKFKIQLAEEEELWRLRKELVPRAQPMPFI